MDLQSRVGSQEGPGLIGPVGPSIVPKDHDRTPTNVAQQVAEELHHLLGSNRVLVDLNVELALRCHSADRGELRPATLVHEHRGLANRSPGLRDIRDEREPTLVDKDHYSSAASGFFLYRGQDRSLQLSTARRFFSRAWRRGRCQENPWLFRISHVALWE